MSFVLTESVYNSIIADVKARAAFESTNMYAVTELPRGATYSAFMAALRPLYGNEGMAFVKAVSQDLASEDNFALFSKVGKKNEAVAAPIATSSKVVAPSRAVSNADDDEEIIEEEEVEYEDDPEDEVKKQVVLRPKTELANVKVSSAIKLDELDEDDIAVEEINFSQQCAQFFSEFTHYETDVIARTVIAYCKQRGITTSPASGVVISDPHARGRFDTVCGNLERSQSIYAVLNSALAHVATKKQVVANYQTYDSFSRKAISYIGDDPVVDGQRLCVRSLPAVIMKPITEKPDHDVESKMGRLAVDVALLLTTNGLRTPLSLEFSTVDKRTGDAKVVRGVWTIAPEFVSLFTGKFTDLGRSVAMCTRILFAKGYTVIHGLYGTKNVSVWDFVNLSVKSWEKRRDVASLLKHWRTIRAGTFLDDAWMKHDFLTVKCARQPDFLPYNSTAMKLILGYAYKFSDVFGGKKNWSVLERLAELKGKVLFIYGGITSNGKNSQLLAMRHMLKEVLGDPIVDTFGNQNVSGRWSLITIDINGNSAYGTISVDAANLDSVLSLDPNCQMFENVCVHLDLADDSVTESSNNSIGVFVSNFLQLSNVRFVTSKYCASGKITVNGASCVVPLCDPLVEQDVPVGRSHGVEGITFSKPSVTKRAPVTRHPFAKYIRFEDRVKVIPYDDEVFSVFFDRLKQGNRARLSPQAFLDCSSLGGIVPPSFGAVSGARVAQTEISDSVVSVFDGEEYELDDEAIAHKNTVEQQRAIELGQKFMQRTKLIEEAIRSLNDVTEIARVTKLINLTGPRIKYCPDSDHNDLIGLTPVEQTRFKKGILNARK